MQYYRDYRKKKKKKTGKILAILLSLLLVLLIVIVIKTIIYPFAKFETPAVTEQTNTGASDEAVWRLAKAIRIPTISQDADKTTDNPFDSFKVYLSEAYPEVYKAMDTLSINKYGLLFHWKGKDTLRNPILFLAHYDVAPVVRHKCGEDMFGEEVFRPGDPKKEAIGKYQTAWDFPPFSGAVANGRIYGRGTLDAKSMMMAHLEAATTLLANSFQPEQDIWFAYGFDQETGGTKGALKIAEYFKQNNITFDAVYGEGSVVTAPGVAGIDRPVALVGIAEKGSCTISITVKEKGGHSSMPPSKSSLVLAAEIIEKLNSKQFPADIIPLVKTFLDNVGGDMNFISRMAIANQWLLEAPLLKLLKQDPATNALVRTTTAVTMVKGSNAPNILSTTADITVNFCILTGDSVGKVVNHVKEICDGYDVDIRVDTSCEPSSLSSEKTRAWRAVKNAIARLYPEASMVACIALTATDAQRYETTGKNVYRIMPVCLNEYEQRTIHNENEHISLENYGRMIAYYKNLMKLFETIE
ncbi:MAG: M20/M25/M40 family metallo-hydrolase [Mediterranea sp.]|jgi:carboxypeptidase PM20D1|nr:M20/M25/M40 family metallo-hydrolase [Mediterranea sp.]